MNAPTQTPLLEVRDLEVKYGNITALHGISFTVDEGEIVTLIGANGAGKTTTLHSIARLPPPEAPKVSAGDILINGKSILKTPAHDVVRYLHCALAPEGRHIFGNLTVTENLTLATFSRPKTDDCNKDYDHVFELFPRLAERRNQRSESLSGGEQQMLSVGRALM
ncbi:MAG TPA: ATP-binding cassette domain-containing protein, partial [Desulfarculaceae bacterium]|nr:ATP-binding cassette domain-containing protein [Desulfarculaceae bacterium]